MNVNRRIEHNVGYVEINNPPVNAIGVNVRQGLLDAVKWAEENQLDRVIISGGGNIFAAGADTSEFNRDPVEPHLPDVLNAIEQSHVPWIAAINGIALGGGAEIALACRMRIMSTSSKIGFPEVTLGVVPGAGGTQRLPKLIGLEKALTMIVQGKPIDANAALRAGLVHAIEEEVLDAAFMVNTEDLLCRVPTGELPSPEHNADVVSSAKQLIARKSNGQIAPAVAINVVESGLSTSLEEGLAIERKAFLELRGSTQANALRHIFFSERAAKVPKQLKHVEPQNLEHIAVAGGGTMGAGIAYALLNAGLRVSVLEVDKDAVERANQNINRIVDASAKRGLINDKHIADIRTRLTVTTDYSSAADASLSIEAAFESMAVKKSVLEALNDTLPAHSTIATNTSYLDVNEIASFLPDPGRVLGLHFFAPAHIMRLLEIVRGDQTKDVHLATGFKLAKLLGKIPVVAGVCDGFIGNRILARYREAADTVLMDGSTPWEIDEAMVKFGYAMGPYEAQDISGLDIAHANRRRQDATRDPNRRYIPIADRMVELGKLGKKTGAGWYRYSAEGKIDDPIVADLALEEARLAGIDRKEYTATDITDRLTTAMINEAANILYEGIAESAKDIDLVTVFGYGFPRWRGGLMHYADSLGVESIIEKINRYAKEDPIPWKVSPLLLYCEEKGSMLADFHAEK
ncbi:MAG: enoyl-CoA hydratase/isomerase family protein [Gammaproteobacteria bacterium]|nr:enoyl-CoA hydratase/isomerase family protein [Gammaproteobacteria bacterium]